MPLPRTTLKQVAVAEMDQHRNLYICIWNTKQENGCDVNLKCTKTLQLKPFFFGGGYNIQKYVALVLVY